MSVNSYRESIDNALTVLAELDEHDVIAGTVNVERLLDGAKAVAQLAIADALQRIALAVENYDD